MKLSPRIFAFLLVFVFSSVCLPQNKPDAKPEKQSERKKEKQSNKKPAAPVVVKANVSVADAGGKLVNDLKAEDFKIYEDGVEQKITSFTRKESALSVVFVVDNSGSLRSQLKTVSSIVSSLAAGLRPARDEALIVRFVGSDNITTVQEWTSDKALLTAAPEYFYAEGGQSAIIDALYLSAQQILEREKTDKSKRCALVLISDGEERASYYDAGALFALFEKSDAQIFSFAVVQDLQASRIDYDSEKRKARTVKNVKEKAAAFVQTLALETGGAAYIFDKKYTPDDVNAALKSLAAELGSQYIVGYTSTNQKRDGLPRKLAVQINDGAAGEKRQAAARESFVVPEEKK